MSLELISLYDQYCRDKGIPVFPVTPVNLHTCRPGQCTFHDIGKKESICTASRHIHTCSEQCPFLKIEEEYICGLTNRTLGARLDYRYYDGSTSFTPRRRHTQLTPAQVKTIIETTITDIVSGKGRVAAEDIRNRRTARHELVAITKKARTLKLHRGNWLLYYELFIAHSARHERYIPNRANVTTLASLIYKFYQTLYPTTVPVHRVLVCFTAVCVSELAAPTGPVFPHIPWVEKIVPAHTNMYSRCTLVTCRGMTATLMNLLTKASAINAVFPLS